MQMLWNWYTIDSCFIARSWHVRSSGAFAGSCIGVILLVISLEFLRRAQRELDRYFRRVNSSSISSHQPSAAAAAQPTGEESGSSASSGRSGKGLTAAVTGRGMVDGGRMTTVVGPLKWWQQLVRSALFMVQFAVGYFVMLLAMYYNGELFLDPFLFFFFGGILRTPRARSSPPLHPVPRVPAGVVTRRRVRWGRRKTYWVGMRAALSVPRADEDVFGAFGWMVY